MRTRKLDYFWTNFSKIRGLEQLRILKPSSVPPIPTRNCSGKNKKMFDQILRVKLKNLFKVIVCILALVLFEKYRKGDQEYSEIIDVVEDEFLGLVRITSKIYFSK